jgi:hypothetical protein
MLQFSMKDLDVYKENLNRRKQTFQVEMKRSERNILINGKKVAKLKQRNSITPLSKSESSKVLNLFASVKKSVNAYCREHNFKVPKTAKQYDSSYRNYDLFNSLPNDTDFLYVDVKHCYWRIAYITGVISPNLYNKILEQPEMKLWRNMALSCIIAPKQVEYFSGGEKINTIVEDVSMYETIYENIRYFSWNIFGNLCFNKIGKENCIGYFTDGIMIFEDDLAKVKTVLARHKLPHRIMKCRKTDYREFVIMDDGQVRRF